MDTGCQLFFFFKGQYFAATYQQQLSLLPWTQDANFFFFFLKGQYFAATYQQQLSLLPWTQAANFKKKKKRTIFCSYVPAAALIVTMDTVCQFYLKKRTIFCSYVPATAFFVTMDTGCQLFFLKKDNILQLRTSNSFLCYHGHRLPTFFKKKDKYFAAKYQLQLCPLPSTMCTYNDIHCSSPALCTPGIMNPVDR